MVFLTKYIFKSITVIKLVFFCLKIVYLIANWLISGLLDVTNFGISYRSKKKLKYQLIIFISIWAKNSFKIYPYN